MAQAKKHIILHISNQGIFYNEEERLAWSRTNFPDKATFTLTEREQIYWEVAMVRYDKAGSILEVEVSSYRADPGQASFPDQKPKYPIKQIWFRNIDWQELQKVMNAYKPQDFEGLVDFSKPPETKTKDQSDQEALIGYRYGGNFGKQKQTGSAEEVEIQFSYPLIKTRFKMGCVEIEKKKIKGVKDPVRIVLENDFIIPEFDHVKPYFSKILGKKKIEVRGHLKIGKKGEVNVRCQSQEINQIDEALITSVKKLHLKNAIFGPKTVAVDKSLFTPEEYFDDSPEKLLGNTLRKSDRELLEEITRLSDIRNKRQLIYLSGKLQSKRARLKFTLSPKFGFLFFVEGEEMDHFLWELLDSHATYIWSIEKDALPLPAKFKAIERIINFIRDHGRMEYLRNPQSSDFIFNKINHKSSQAGVVDGFPKWKYQVNEKLI